MFFYKLNIFFLNISFLKLYESTIVIAHRGASGYLPEHTLASKTLAFAMNSDYIEQDVVLTKDFVPIVLHDIYLDEVTDVALQFPDRKNQTNQRFYAIDFDLVEIKKLKVTERESETKQKYPNRFPAGQSSFQINTLEEEIQLINGLSKSISSIHALDKSGVLTKDNQTMSGIYVEIKRPEFHFSRGVMNLSETVLEVLKKYNFTRKSDKCFLQCFNPIELRRIRFELNSTLKLGNIDLVFILSLIELFFNFNSICEKVQLLTEDSEDPEKLIPNDFYSYWNSKAGLKNISTFADGIGPEKSQLISWQNSTYKPSNLYMVAKELSLFIHAYTFRIDKLPDYALSYNDLLKIFIHDLKLEGLFTDFPDLTLNFIKNNALLNKFNFWLMYCIGIFFWLMY